MHERKHYTFDRSSVERQAEGGGGRGITDHWVEPDVILGSFFPRLFSFCWHRRGERKGGQNVKPSGFNLLTRHGDYAVLMTPWDCIFARHFFLRWLTGVAVLSSFSWLLSYRSHHPNRSLHRNNKRHVAWATIARVYT